MSRCRASHRSSPSATSAWRRDLDKAAKLKAETDKAIATYEKALADARANAQKIAAETHDKLAAETEAKRKTLDAELAGKLEAAEAQITRSKTSAMQNVRGIAVDTTSAIVERLLGQAPSPDEVDAAVVGKTLAELDAAGRARSDPMRLRSDEDARCMKPKPGSPSRS